MGLLPPGAVPGRFATITSPKGMGLLPPGAVPGRFATISSPKGMGLLPPGAVPGRFATISSLKGMGLLPPGAFPGMFATTPTFREGKDLPPLLREAAKSSLGALRRSSSSGEFGRRFCPVMGASSPGLRFTQGLTTFTNLYGIFTPPLRLFMALYAPLQITFLQNNNKNRRLY
jgi:hypothetical protein